MSTEIRHLTATPGINHTESKTYWISCLFNPQIPICLSIVLLLRIFLTFLALTATYWLALKFKRWLGGYTGDCLGATQQVSEIAFYLGLLALWP